jgi:hypothetical protein
MIKESPCLLTGVPRSGSTMIAATINMCGAFAGEMSKRGMYSNDKIREELALLQEVTTGIDEKWIPVNWKREIEDILISQGYKKGMWMYKDSNLSKTWKIWNYAYPNAKWVIVRRRTGDIIQSCMKTGYMTEHSTEEGWLTMVHEYEARFVEMMTEGLNCKIIWPERMVQGNYEQLYELCDWLGLKWNPDALRYIDSLLWKSNKKK